VTEQPRRGEGPRYGTWIRARRVGVFAALTTGFLVGALLALRWPLCWLLLVPALIFGYITLILGATVHRLGRGGYQRRIHELVADAVAGPGGHVLDVGCGSGSLAVAVAKADPLCRVEGVDSWGESWEYSQAQCEENARVEGVSDRVRFQRASAARLPFADQCVDAVVSCLTFHEVRECEDRTDAVTEALRVLRPGGRFAFLDLFDDPTPFTSAQHVLDAVARAGCTVSRDEPLDSLLPLPYPLGGAQVLGYARLVCGDRPQR
jgi:ubiquinone/menaquinone biosynthesis C-methylase UbiE